MLVPQIQESVSQLITKTVIKPLTWAKAPLSGGADGQQGPLGRVTGVGTASRRCGGLWATTPQLRLRRGFHVRPEGFHIWAPEPSDRSSGHSESGSAVLIARIVSATGILPVQGSVRLGGPGSSIR